MLTARGSGGGEPQKPWFTQAPLPILFNSHSTCPVRWLSARLFRHFMLLDARAPLYKLLAFRSEGKVKRSSVGSFSAPAGEVIIKSG